ncbi:hypothetical protein DQM68_17875 [Leptospira mayottensis]|nr:hypothetical protein DQM68_17875 [Leptospira mayottensis]
MSRSNFPFSRSDFWICCFSRGTKPFINITKFSRFRLSNRQISRLTFNVIGSSDNSALVWKKQNEYLQSRAFFEKISII